MLVVRLTNETTLLVPMYLPLAGLTLLVMCIAGIECQLLFERVARQLAAHATERDRTETDTVERQRTFNTLWQALADSHGSTTIPDPVLRELARLFTADLVAVWTSAKSNGTYRVCGTFPVDPATATRLDKIANGSPCFDQLRLQRSQLRISDFKRETTPAFAWFCEENKLQMAILCPVLVRADLVGVMALFYKEKPKISIRLAEEMNAAANLFLCAL
jgi:hypothetical protein